MNRIKSAAVATKNFADRHKTAITIVAVGTVTTALTTMINQAAEKTAREFIKDSGLTGQFEDYLTEDE